MDAATGMVARLTRFLSIDNGSFAKLLSFKRLHNNDTDAWFRSQELQLGLLKSQLKKMQVT